MAGERVGFLDDCSSATGWVVGAWPGITGMASITSDGQQTTFTTLTGTFMTGASAAWAPNWPDWDRNASAGLAMISRKYPGTVDLDRYHYLVARMTAAGTYMALAVNGWDTKAWYTTGLHAVDLRDIPQPNLRGMQPIERTVFQDTSTGATVWRLTRSVRTESCDSFSPDGSALPLYNRSFKGMVLYDFARGGLRELPDLCGAPVFSHSNPSVFYLLQSSAREGPQRPRPASATAHAHEGLLSVPRGPARELAAVLLLPALADGPGQREGSVGRLSPLRRP